LTDLQVPIEWKKVQALMVLLLLLSNLGVPGSDIMLEMYQSGELAEKLEIAAAS